MNRFDVPQGGKFNNRPLYVGMPLEAMAGLAKDYSDKYKQGLSNLDEAKGLLKVNAIDEHKPIQQELLKTYNAKLDVLADKIVKNPTDYSNQIELNKLIREYSNDPNRQELEESFKQKNEYIKQKRELGAEYDFVEDPNYNYSGLTKDRQLNPFRYSGMGKVQNHQKRAAEMMDNLKADGIEWDSSYIGEDGNVYSNKGGKEELLGPKIWKIASSKANDFAQTIEGANYVKHIKAEMPNATQKDIDNQVAQYLYNAGLNHAFSKIKTGGGFEQFEPQHLRDEKKSKETTSRESEGIQNDIPLLNDFSFDDKGNIKPVVFEEKAYIEPGKNAYYEKNILKRPTGKTGIDFEKTGKQKQILENIRNEHLELKNLNDKQVVEAYNKAAKTLSNEQIPLEDLGSIKTRKDIGEKLSMDLLGRAMYIMDGNGVTKLGTKDEILKVLGIKEYNNDPDELGLTDQLKQGISGYTQAGPLPGIYVAEIKDFKGNRRRLMIDSQRETGDTFKVSHKVNEARKSLTTTTFAPIDNLPTYEIQVVPTIHKDGSISHEYFEIDSRDPKNIKINPTDLNAIRKAEKENFKNNY